MKELQDYLASQKANSMTIDDQSASRVDPFNKAKVKSKKKPKSSIFNANKPRVCKKPRVEEDFQGTGYFGRYTRRNKHLGIPKANAS